MAVYFQLPASWQREINAGTPFGKSALNAVGHLLVEHPIVPVGGVSNVGTILAGIFKRKFGVAPCGACQQSVELLNSLTVEEILARKAELAADIASRAEKIAPNWWTRLAVRIDNAVHLGETERRIKILIEEACREGQICHT